MASFSFPHSFAFYHAEMDPAVTNTNGPIPMLALSTPSVTPPSSSPAAVFSSEASSAGSTAESSPDSGSADAAGNNASTDTFSDVGFVPSVVELCELPAVNGKTPYCRMMEYGTEIDKAVESGRPCILDDHKARQADCQHCSAVALFNVRKDHRAKRNANGKSTAHKVDLPTLDHLDEWFSMKEIEKAIKEKGATGQGHMDFDEAVGKLVRSRKFNSPQDKHWVLTHFSLVWNDHCLAWGQSTGEQSGERRGRQRLIKNVAGEKVNGVILFDTVAAIKLHQLHSDGHRGRDAIAAAFQQEGYKSPAKAIITEWLRDCPSCKVRIATAAAAAATRKQKKRGQQEAFGEEEDLPAPEKRSKANSTAARPAAMVPSLAPQPQRPELTYEDLISSFNAQQPLDPAFEGVIDPQLLGIDTSGFDASNFGIPDEEFPTFEF